MDNDFPIIILISGLARSGKDTFAKDFGVYLNVYDDTDKRRILITHFADLLKYILREYLGWDGVKDFDGRMKLQYVGDLCRLYNENYFVDFIKSIISMFSTKYDYILIPDARYPNEIKVLKDAFPGSVIHVHVKNKPIEEKAAKNMQYHHQSEGAIDENTADYNIILNKEVFNEEDWNKICEEFYDSIIKNWR